LVAQLGYLATAPDPTRSSVELEECISQGLAHPDRIRIQKGGYETQGYRRLRSAGFSFAAARCDEASVSPYSRPDFSQSRIDGGANRAHAIGVHRRLIA
jgi:hypothetical protein